MLREALGNRVRIKDSIARSEHGRVYIPLEQVLGWDSWQGIGTSNSFHSFSDLSHNIELLLMKFERSDYGICMLKDRVWTILKCQ